MFITVTKVSGFSTSDAGKKNASKFQLKRDAFFIKKLNVYSNTLLVRSTSAMRSEGSITID